jgi:dynein heavy chain
MESEGL